jgi:LEA14-like dessication related protein
MFCRFCGNEITDDSTFCSKCGKEVSKSGIKEEEKPIEEKEKVVVEKAPEPIKETEVKPEKKGGGWGGLKLFIVFFILVGIGLWYFNTQMSEREAFENVKLQPSGLSVSSAGLTSAAIQIDFTAHNPGKKTATLDRLDYQIYINDKFVLDGSTSKKYSISPGQTKIITVDTTVSYVKAGKAAWELLTAKNAIWSIRGTSYFETPIGTITLPFEQKYTVS